MYSYCKLKISFNDGDTNIYNKCIITENLYGSNIETEQGTLNMLKVIKIEKLIKDLTLEEMSKLQAKFLPKYPSNEHTVFYNGNYYEMNEFIDVSQFYL